MRVLLTGATGFIGRHLAAALQRHGMTVRAALRAPAALPDGVESVIVGDLGGSPDWRPALAGVDAVIHAAGIAHAGTDIPEGRYRQINHAATMHLAHAAQGRAGRFIFVSSIRAQSGPSAPGVLTEMDEPQPTDAYGRSKLAAERGLAEIDGLPAAALRPVLVYGAGVRGNMGALMRLAKLPVPLPFAGFEAGRSLVAVETLADAVLHLLVARNALTGPFIVADPEPVSVAQVVAALRAGAGRSAGLFRVPEEALRRLLGLVGRADMVERLASPLVADAVRLREAGFTPTTTSMEGLSRLAVQRPAGGGHNRE